MLTRTTSNLPGILGLGSSRSGSYTCLLAELCAFQNQEPFRGLSGVVQWPVPSSNSKTVHNNLLNDSSPYESHSLQWIYIPTIWCDPMFFNPLQRRSCGDMAKSCPSGNMFTGSTSDLLVTLIVHQPKVQTVQHRSQP